MVSEPKRMREGKISAGKKSPSATGQGHGAHSSFGAPDSAPSFLWGQLWVQGMPRGAVGDRKGLCPISKLFWKRASHYQWADAAGKPVMVEDTDLPHTSQVKLSELLKFSEPQWHVCKWGYQKFFHYRFVVSIKGGNICKTLSACTVMLFKG